MSQSPGTEREREERKQPNALRTEEDKGVCVCMCIKCVKSMKYYNVA